MLKESEKRYKDLADLLPEGVFECSTDGTITYVNHQAYTLFGYEPDSSFDNKKVLDFIIPGDRARALDSIRSVIGGAPSRPHEYEAQRPDGSTFPVIIHSAPVYQDGVITGLRGVIIDISERKKAEDEIRKSKQQLADVIDFFPDATVIINVQGEVIFWNRAMVALTGIAAEEMVGKGDYAYAVPFYGEKRPILVDMALNPDQVTPEKYYNLRRDGDIIVGEAYMTCLGPEVVYLWGVASPLRNPDGEIVGAIECIRDITSRKQAEEALKKSREELEILVSERTAELMQANLALRESEERYRTLVELSPDAIYVHDGRQILYANPAGLRLLGAEKDEEIVGQNPLSFVHPDYIPIVTSRVDSSLSGTPANPPVEECFVGLSGEILQVEVSTMTIRYQGKPAILVVARDISGRKQAEAQLREYAQVLEDKNHELDFLTNRLIKMNRELDDRVRERTDEVNRLLKQKDDFINQLGHDLKKPLTPLVALLPTLLHEEQDTEGVNSMGFYSGLCTQSGNR
jgi:PAS domain S-box-containing protein